MSDDLSEALRKRGPPRDEGPGEMIRSGLQTRFVGREIYGYETIPSTNQVALNLGEKGAPDGTLVIADFQSAGRGRFGRSWTAPAGTCLLLSLLLRPSLHVSRSYQVAMATALGVAEGIQRTAGFAPRLKWPNDLLISGRKVSGLLLECRVLGDRLEFAVVGIGINVNLDTQQVEGIPPEATSLRTALGREISRLTLLQAVLEGIDRRYVGLLGGQSVLAEWSGLLDTLGRRVRVQLWDRIEEGLALEVSEAGALRIRRADNQILEIAAGDVLHLDPTP